jgi:sensor histidine kinase YesM
MILYLVIVQYVMLAVGAGISYVLVRKQKANLKEERERINILINDSATKLSTKVANDTEMRLSSVLTSSIEASERIAQAAVKTASKNIKDYIDEQLGTVVTVVSPYKG